MSYSELRSNLRPQIHRLVTLIILCLPTQYFGTDGRAIMVEPPHRSSLWRFNYSNALVNLKDDNLNCGGYDWQWRVHGGRCGVCGDRFNGSQDHADNGKYATGTIVRKYEDGHYINVTFEVSSNYLGYVEFKLCPRNSSADLLDQTCFNKYPLYIDESHGTRYYIGSRGGIYDIHIRLPGGLVCKHCVLQWKYKTGYRYNGEDTCKCLGCGSQEQYVNCADIEISPREGWHTHPPGRWNVRGHAIDHRGHLVRGRINPAVIQPTKTIKPATIEGATTLIPPQRTTKTVETNNKSVTPSHNMTNRKTSLNPSHGRKGSTSDLSPSYSSLKTSKFPEPTPTFTTPRVDVTTSVLQHRTISSDRIKQEIIKMIGREIPKGSNGNDIKVFFTVPLPGTGATVGPKLVPEPTRQFGFLQTDVPNTQYVSVSSILDRFYPNYITPFLFSLTKPRRTSNLGSSRACDVTSDEFRCVARGIYNQSPGISKWCERNCRASNCVSFMCECFCEDRRRIRTTNCHAIKEFKGVEGMDLWCTANCKVGYCPPNTCSVEDCLKPDTSSNGEA